MLARLSILCIAILFCCGTTFGATMTVSGIAPTPDGADIFQLSGTTDIGGDEGHAWSNRPNQGQSFLTGSNATGYTLDAFTMRVRVDQASTTSPSWDLRIGTIDGSNIFTPIASESATGVAIPNGIDNWVTWALDSTVNLDPDTLYGFDVFPTGSGFISLNSDANSNPYTDGQAFSSGDNLPASPPNPLTLGGSRTLNDRVFHLNLTQNAAVPEPGSILMWMLGAIAVLFGWAARARRKSN